MSAGRRAFLCAALPLASPALARRAQDPDALDRAEWAAFKERFLSPEGRVVDTGNGGVSHSEGQGYGLLFAVAWDDRDAFERILAWTGMRLRGRADGLLPWRYDPRASPPVGDLNNASDGDLYVAWALLRGAARWNHPPWQDQARRASAALLGQCALRARDLFLLLPGAEGFRQFAAVTVNPSYYAFPALRALARLPRHGDWDRIGKDGVALLDAASARTRGFVPDWLHVPLDAPLRQARWAPDRPPRFSFDAVRVPLHLVWGGHKDARAVTGPMAALRARRGERLPAWLDLRTRQVAPYPASAGTEAVARLCFAAHGFPTPWRELPRMEAAQDYFSAALLLLVRLAWKEAGLPRA